MRHRPIWIGLALSAALVLGTASSVAEAAPPGNPAHDVIANLFEWNWDSVAAECTNVLGPNGFGGVQVSPPQESISLPGTSPAHPWWEVYQPVSYQLTSRFGNRQQFAAMVTACHNAGISVYADAVINHMTGQDSGGTGYGGSTFTDKHQYPGTYSGSDFHYYPNDCPNANGTVADYNNAQDVQNCELLGLADLKTQDDTYVRGRIAEYLNDLISLGVDGFRVDAAKHMSPDDLAAIKSRLNGSPYLYQEVMPGGAVNPGQYEGNGDILEFTYGQKLKEQFQGSIANLQTFGQTWGFEPADKSVTFVDNHDTDRNGSTLTYKDGQTYLLATIFHLAWGYGTPQVYSSFTFSSNDQSPPAGSDGMVTGTDCGSSAWNCTVDNQAILGMVGWHNAVSGTSVQNWWSDGANVIAFSRGSAGFVTINNSNSAVTRTFTTGLAAGTYSDVIHGTTVTVDGSGTASITVPAKDAVAIHG